jgi:hypothetical protein
MATAKAAKKTPAAPAAEKPKNALVKWDEVLAARAIMAQQSEAKVGGGKFISIKSGVMSFNGSPVPGNALDVVVVDSVLENQLYLGKYNPDVVQVPDCFAFGRNEKDMVPHKDSANPQADSCAECPHNEWGSADTGKGKKCGNVRRLALIPADALDKGEEGVKETELTFFKVPVTSSPNWTNYVNTLAAQGHLLGTRGHRRRRAAGRPDRQVRRCCQSYRVPVRSCRRFARRSRASGGGTSTVSTSTRRYQAGKTGSQILERCRTTGVGPQARRVSPHDFRRSQWEPRSR